MRSNNEIERITSSRADFVFHIYLFILFLNVENHHSRRKFIARTEQQEKRK